LPPDYQHKQHLIREDQARRRAVRQELAMTIQYFAFRRADPAAGVQDLSLKRTYRTPDPIVVTLPEFPSWPVGHRPKPSKRDRAAIKRERRTGCHKTAIVALIERPQLDDAEATYMHRPISVGNVTVLPKTPIATSIIEQSARSGVRWLQHVVP